MSELKIVGVEHYRSQVLIKIEGDYEDFSEWFDLVEARFPNLLDQATYVPEIGGILAYVSDEDLPKVLEPERAEPLSIQALIEKHGLTFEHVRLLHESDDKKPWERVLRYQVRVKNDEGSYLTEYGMGIGHLGKVPFASPGLRANRDRALKAVFARRMTTDDLDDFQLLCARAKPDPVDILACLARDAETDLDDLEDTGVEDPFELYKKCRETRKALVKMLGHDGFAELVEAARDH